MLTLFNNNKKLKEQDGEFQLILRKKNSELALKINKDSN